PARRFRCSAEVGAGKVVDGGQGRQDQGELTWTCIFTANEHSSLAQVWASAAPSPRSLRARAATSHSLHATLIVCGGQRARLAQPQIARSWPCLVTVRAP